MKTIFEKIIWPQVLSVAQHKSGSETQILPSAQSAQTSHNIRDVLSLWHNSLLMKSVSDVWNNVLRKMYTDCAVYLQPLWAQFYQLQAYEITMKEICIVCRRIKLHAIIFKVVVYKIPTPEQTALPLFSMGDGTSAQLRKVFPLNGTQLQIVNECCTQSSNYFNFDLGWRWPFKEQQPDNSCVHGSWSETVKVDSNKNSDSFFGCFCNADTLFSTLLIQIY